jgi:hypothetical protein
MNSKLLRVSSSIFILMLTLHAYAQNNRHEVSKDSTAGIKCDLSGYDTLRAPSTHQDSTVHNYQNRLAWDAAQIHSMDSPITQLKEQIRQEKQHLNNDSNHIRVVDSCIDKIALQKKEATKNPSNVAPRKPAHGKSVTASNPDKQLDSLRSLKNSLQRAVDHSSAAIKAMTGSANTQMLLRDALVNDTLELRRKIDNYPPVIINTDYWKKPVMYVENGKIVIVVAAKHKPGYDKKIVIDTTGCKLRVLDIQYYAAQGAASGKDILDNTYDTGDIMRLLDGLDIDINQIRSYKKDSGILVNCETLKEYMDDLPESFEEASAKKNKFYLITSLTIGASGGNVFVDTGYSANANALTRRNESQKQIIGYNFGVMLGYRPPVASRRHLLYCELLYSVMGFQSRYNYINWQTGLLGSSNDLNAVTTYKFKTITVGIGYMYAPEPNWWEGRRINLLFQIGGYYSRGLGKSNNTAEIDHSSEKYILQNRFGAKAGLGLTIHFCRCANVNILPLYQVDFTALNHGQLSTKLYLKGVNIGLALH